MSPVFLRNSLLDAEHVERPNLPQQNLCMTSSRLLYVELRDVRRVYLGTQLKEGKLIMTKLSRKMMLIIILRLENVKLIGGGTFNEIFPEDKKIKAPKLS